MTDLLAQVKVLYCAPLATLVMSVLLAERTDVVRAELLLSIFSDDVHITCSHPPVHNDVFRHVHLIITDVLCVCRELCLDQMHQLPDTGCEWNQLLPHQWPSCSTFLSKPCLRLQESNGDMDPAEEAEETTDMDQFFAKVAEVREKMAAMSVGQQELMRLHDESKTAVQVSFLHRFDIVLSLHIPVDKSISQHSDTPESFDGSGMEPREFENMEDGWLSQQYLTSQLWVS